MADRGQPKRVSVRPVDDTGGRVGVKRVRAGRLFGAGRVPVRLPEVRDLVIVDRHPRDPPSVAERGVERGKEPALEGASALRECAA